jgi:hypothetical protein
MISGENRRRSARQRVHKRGQIIFNSRTAVVSHVKWSRLAAVAQCLSPQSRALLKVRLSRSSSDGRRSGVGKPGIKSVNGALANIRKGPRYQIDHKRLIKTGEMFDGGRWQDLSAFLQAAQRSFPGAVISISSSIPW